MKFKNQFFFNHIFNFIKLILFHILFLLMKFNPFLFHRTALYWAVDKSNIELVKAILLNGKVDHHFLNAI